MLLFRNELQLTSGDPVKLTHCNRGSTSEFRLVRAWNAFDGARGFSAKSMRSKVEKRMQRESGKTQWEIHRAQKLRKKLMTDEERLMYKLRRVCSLICMEMLFVRSGSFVLFSCLVPVVGIQLLYVFCGKIGIAYTLGRRCFYLDSKPISFPS